MTSDAIFDIPSIEKEFFLKQLKDLDPKKAVGMDGVSSKLLKLAAPAITSSVTKVINLSIKASKFPTLWKLARVWPIFKRSKHGEDLSYRPIQYYLCIVKNH